jgi:hypothetical protein
MGVKLAAVGDSCGRFDTLVETRKGSEEDLQEVNILSWGDDICVFTDGE